MREKERLIDLLQNAIDNEGFFDTIKNNIPDLLRVTRQILTDVKKKV